MNLLSPLPDAVAAEWVDLLLSWPGLRIERIVSLGQASRVHLVKTARLGGGFGPATGYETRKPATSSVGFLYTELRLGSELNCLDGPHC